MQGHTPNFFLFNTPYYPNQRNYNPNQIPQYYLYSETHNASWENYPDFPYQNNLYQPQKSSLETALENFISSYAQDQQFNSQLEEMQVSPSQAQPLQRSNLEILLKKFISTQIG